MIIPQQIVIGIRTGTMLVNDNAFGLPVLPDRGPQGEIMWD